MMQSYEQKQPFLVDTGHTIEVQGVTGVYRGVSTPDHASTAAPFEGLSYPYPQQSAWERIINSAQRVKVIEPEDTIESRQK